MNSDAMLNELYQEVILDHSKSPRNIGVLDAPTNSAVGNNPLCGDSLVLYLKVEDGKIVDVRFSGVGCAISTASASMMCEAIKGKTTEAARELFEKFYDMLIAKGSAEELGKLGALAGTREFPMRVKCATLAWHTLLAALDNQKEAVTTEGDGNTP